MNKVPISKNLRQIIDLKKLSKINYISKGDDYQVLFTAPKNMSEAIRKISIKNRIKLTKIGIIHSVGKKSSIVDRNNREISIKNKGYFHQF